MVSVILDDIKVSNDLEFKLRGKRSKISKRMRTLFVQMDEHLLHLKHRDYHKVRILNTLTISGFNLNSFYGLREIEINGTTSTRISLPPNFFEGIHLPHCKEFICRYTDIVKLPNMPKCEILNVENNKIKELPNLPMCTWIDCSRNLLTEIPSLPNVEVLDCSSNQLVVIPYLPSCININCSSNRVEVIMSLPQCRTLTCNNNKLTTLCSLPNCIFLHCKYNLLSELPLMPKCTHLYCYGNKFEHPIRGNFIHVEQ